MSKDQINLSEAYRSLFEDAYSVMLIIDPENGKILDANRAALKFYGYSKQEIFDLSISQINTLSDSQVREEMKKSKALKRNYFNFKHQMKDGEIKDVEVYSGPIEYHKKKALYSIIHDISDKVKVLKTLKENESTIRAMINTTTSLVYLFNINGDIVNLNNPGALLFNKSPLEMIGKNFKAYFGENDFSKLRLMVEEVVETHEPISYQKERDNRFYDVQLYPVFNENNQVYRICVFANDITDLKMSEKVMAAIETAGAICHEMNQPLQVIVGNLEILKMNLDENDPNLDIVQNLMTQTEKLGSITKQLTNITRYETKAYIRGTIFDIDRSSSPKK